jgi:site-specific DNA-methyltransferase (adenine-specific)
VTGASAVADQALVASLPEPVPVSAHPGDGPWRIERIGRATLYLGDCREVLPTLGKVDAVVTDPPYGIGAGQMTFGMWRTSRMPRTQWDGETPDLSAVLALELPTIIWGGNYFVLPPSRCFLVWDKGAGFRGRDFAECEQAWCSVDGNARVLNRDPLACRDYASKVHPTQKPLAVMRWSIDHLGSPGIILDPFMGAGSTGVAAVQMGLGFVGIEREERYFEEACRRLREVSGEDQGPLFAAQVDTHPKGGDSLLAPFMGSAVGCKPMRPDTQVTDIPSNTPEKG